MATNVNKPTCYCEDHIIYNDEKISRKCTDSAKGNNYKSKQNAHSTAYANNKTSK